MKRLLFFLFVPLLAFASKPRLAVFQVDSELLGPTQSKLISEMLTAECSKSMNYEVIPWQEIGNALRLVTEKDQLKELGSGPETLDCTTSNCYNALGSLDVRYMVTARVEKPGQRLRMTLKLTDVENMKQVNILSTSAADVDALLDDLPNVTMSLLGAVASDEDVRAQAQKLAQRKQDSLETIKRQQAEQERQRKAKELELERQAKEARAQLAVKASTDSTPQSSSILVPSLRWGGVGLAVLGSYLAYNGNSRVDAAYEAKTKAVSTNDPTNFESAKSDSKTATTQRTAGLGVAVLGLLSFGVSFAF
jgi:hypothetical protein